MYQNFETSIHIQYTLSKRFYKLPRAVIFPILPRVAVSIDCIAGLMAVPETDDRVNWVKSCWRDDRLVVVAVDVVVGIEEPVCNGDIKLGARLDSKRIRISKSSLSSNKRLIITRC